MSKEDRQHQLRVEQLKRYKALPLPQKVALTERRIDEWYRKYDGNVHVSFSGGKDSTVLLHIARNLFPNIKAVFCDTGLEYPEIREFVKQTLNVVTIRPKMSFKQVLETYGYPVVSKKIAKGVSRYRNTDSEVQRNLRLYGGINPTSGKKQFRDIPEKWKFLIDAPFKISERCCDVMKKHPFDAYERKTGSKPMIGTMVSDSLLRMRFYHQTGCNAFDAKHPMSKPISFWNEEDVWKYIRAHEVPYCKIYDMGEDRTGCMFCMFGLFSEARDDNRFTRMEITHPKQYKFCMEKLGLGEIIQYLYDCIDQLP